MKADIYARQNKAKLQLDVNMNGQPCGPSGTKFANFIGTLVRTKGFPIAHDDWRKVCPRQKYKLWTDAKVLKLVANYVLYSCDWVLIYYLCVCTAILATRQRCLPLVHEDSSYKVEGV
jgi:hypothetical protein